LSRQRELDEQREKERGSEERDMENEEGAIRSVVDVDGVNEGGTTAS
jgi:hypothetical protein